jgi:predicted HD phosphohydrolase
MDHHGSSEERAQFHSMEEGTQEDWAIIARDYVGFAAGLPDRVLAHLKLLVGDFGGFPIDRLTHSLQTATRAHRDGRPESYVVMALLHDIGDTLGSYNHPEIAAAILQPFVSEEEHWICRNHGAFQGYYYFHYLGIDRNVREKHRDNPHFDACAEFCAKYDQSAFDPDYDTLPLDFFEPMVRRVLARPRSETSIKAMETTAAKAGVPA